MSTQQVCKDLQSTQTLSWSTMWAHQVHGPFHLICSKDRRFDPSHWHYVFLLVHSVSWLMSGTQVPNSYCSSTAQGIYWPVTWSGIWLWWYQAKLEVGEIWSITATKPEIRSPICSTTSLVSWQREYVCQRGRKLCLCPAARTSRNRTVQWGGDGMIDCVIVISLEWRPTVYQSQSIVQGTSWVIDLSYGSLSE
jgi:hypothetical protein